MKLRRLLPRRASASMPKARHGNLGRRHLPERRAAARSKPCRASRESIVKSCLQPVIFTGMVVGRGEIGVLLAGSPGSAHRHRARIMRRRYARAAAEVKAAAIAAADNAGLSTSQACQA